MSYTAKVNFVRISEECFEICNRMEERLEGIRGMLEILDQYVDEEIDTQTHAYVALVYQKIDEWTSQLDYIIGEAEHLSQIGHWNGDTDDYIFQNRYVVKDEAYELMSNINREAATIKPALYVITKELRAQRRERIAQARKNEQTEIQRVIKEQKEAQRKQRDENHRRIGETINSLSRSQNAAEKSTAIRPDHIPAADYANETRKSPINRFVEEKRNSDNYIRNREERQHKEKVKQKISEQITGRSLQNDSDSVQALLEGIDDNLLRQFTHIAHLCNPALCGDDLLSAGVRLREEAEKQVEMEAEMEKERCRAEMTRNNVPSDIIEKALASNEDGQGLERIYQQTDEAIIGEAMRKKSLQIILKSISNQGFSVDRKNIRRKDDVVTLIAQKPGGETAKFSVYLDGKFIYDFKGYEGQACQKDLQPFLTDLQNIYGFEITETEEIWKNPDRIQSQKMCYKNSDTIKH